MNEGWRPSTGWALMALGCLVGGPLAALLAMPERPAVEAPMAQPAPAPAPAAVSPVPVPAGVVAAASVVGATPAPAAPAAVVPARAAAEPEPGQDPTPDLRAYLNPGEQPTMAEVIARLHAAGVHSGLGAFQPPGTRPPLVGLAVPEDFVLPPGYVRHHQATDDGQRIEAILMFSPDHVWVDAAGRPIALPADRVVPPELAPPGLPLRRIVVPAPVEPGR